MVNMIAIGGAVLILRPGAPGWFLAWTVAALMLTAGRMALYSYGRRVRRRAPEQAPAPLLVATHTTTVMLSGVLWGALGWWGIPEYAGAQQFAILVMLSSLAGGATGTLAPMRVTGKLYVLLLVAPACARILAQGSDAHILLAALGGMFAWVMISSHHSNHILLTRSIALAHDKERLLDALSAKTEQVLKTNSELEARVAARTHDLHYLANHDALTDLLNRRGMAAAESALRAHAGARLLTLFIDLDHFKQINDGLGHDWGDLALCEVSQRLTRHTPALAQAAAKLSLVCRWGGDEFVVCLAVDALHADAAWQAANTLHAQLTAPCVIQGRALRLGASVGVDLQDLHPELSLLGAIGRADLAASEAKRQGRGQVMAYRPELADQRQRKLALSAALNAAHHDGSLHLLFQPIVSAHDGAAVAFEALLRWRPAGFGPVSPDEFIPLAEESEHILAIGDWVLRQACAAAARWPGGAHDGPPKVAVNISIRQLVRADFSARVSAVLADCQLAPAQLIVEVTETVFDDANLHQVRNSLRALYALGVEIHLDDFGAGYSSLSRLSQLPLHAIKIDKSFVMSEDARAAAIIEGAVLIARRFGLRVIAEGIESAELADVLAELGVDELQGYFFGRPDSAPALQAHHWPTRRAHAA